MPITPAAASIIGSGIGAAGSLGGGMLAGSANKKEGKRQWRRTKVLNQNQIQWRVNDAKAAGIHPLAALGMSPIGNAANTTGSVMGDALQNAASAVGQGVSNYATAKANEKAQALLEAESIARTKESLARADQAQATADATRSQQFWSTIGRFKSPGRPNTNTAFGETYRIPKYLDPNTTEYSRPISQAHAQVIEDVSPGSSSGAPLTIHGAGGLSMPVDPTWTPGDLVEQLLGESGGFISFLNLLHSLPKATTDKGAYIPDWMLETWDNRGGRKQRRELEAQFYERINK